MLRSGDLEGAEKNLNTNPAEPEHHDGYEGLPWSMKGKGEGKRLSF